MKDRATRRRMPDSDADRYENRRDFLRLLTGGVVGAGMTQLASCIQVEVFSRG